jgi:hypothetical protein
VKALYRGWGIACAGTQVYARLYRGEWLQKIEQEGVRRRAELVYEELDGLQALRRKVRPELFRNRQAVLPRTIRRQNDQGPRRLGK